MAAAVDGSSEGWRVSPGTLGHHDARAVDAAAIEFDGPDEDDPLAGSGLPAGFAGLGGASYLPYRRFGERDPRQA